MIRPLKDEMLPALKTAFIRLKEYKSINIYLSHNSANASSFVSAYNHGCIVDHFWKKSIQNLVPYKDGVSALKNFSFEQNSAYTPGLMPTSLTPAELREYIKDKKWIMQYNELAAVVDPKTEKVLYIEHYGPQKGFFIEGWRALHYPITSKIVERSWREGGFTITLLHQGHSGLDLKPSMAPFGISDCTVTKDEVELGFAGIGGAGVSVAFSRGTAQGVTRTQILEEGGGGKTGRSIITLPRKRLLLVGVDDTDNDEEGATYALVHNIAESVSKKQKCWYAIHVNVQLYPYNKFKTRNCFATVVGIVFETEEQKAGIISGFEKQLKKYTCSPNSAMATFEGFCFQNQYIDYANSLKFRVAHDIDELKSIAQKQDIQMHVITGERGLFGAIGALAYFDRPEYAAKLPTLLI